MTITAAIVLFAMIWWMVFFIVLPLRFQSQAEAGSIVPGTPAGAPSTENVGKKAKITTAVAVVLWVVFAWVITSGLITVRDFDFMHVLHPEPAAQP